MKLIIVGAGGHGREIASIVAAMPHAPELLGFLDDGLDPGAYSFGSVLGPSSQIPDAATHFVVGIGSPHVRETVALSLHASGLEAFTAVHPMASVGERVMLGDGCVLGAGTHLVCDVTIGNHTQLHANCVVSHDGVLGDYVVVTPRVALAGNVTIGDRAWLGVGCTLNMGVTVGADALVGAGAVVIRDVAPNDVVIGNPAKVLRQNRP